MSYRSDYFKNKAIDQRELTKQDLIFRTIEKNYIDENYENLFPESNNSIIKKEIIEDYIESTYGWRRTSTGFEYHNNFHLDETGKDILFDIYQITKQGDKYISDGSKISDDFIKNNSDILNTLININNQVNDLYTNKYLSDIQNQLVYLEQYWNFHKGSLSVDQKVFEHVRHTDLYFKIYGELGKKVLIKWLNELSDTNKNMEELLEQFISDTKEANIYLNDSVKEKYLKNYKFEYVLLIELMNYSPRGECLRNMYRNKIYNTTKNRQKTITKTKTN